MQAKLLDDASQRRQYKPERARKTAPSKHSRRAKDLEFMRANANVTGDQCQVRPKGADAIGCPC
jgi:hypothetical protein